MLWNKSYPHSSWEELCIAAEQLNSLLNKYKVAYWTEAFSKLNTEMQSYRKSAKITPGMYALLRKVKDIYGSMGSFSDFSFDPRAGVLIDINEQAQADKQLYSLRSEIYRLTDYLLKGENRENWRRSSS